MQKFKCLRGSPEWRMKFTGLAATNGRDQKPRPETATRNRDKISGGRMAKLQTQLSVRTNGQGLHLITSEVQAALGTRLSGEAGLVQLFLQHTSASLLIQENASPSASADLEEFLKRVAPENQSWHRHLDEGPDDTVSHMKAALISPSLLIPYDPRGQLLLGTWQGLYLWEHRRAPHQRSIVITAL